MKKYEEVSRGSRAMNEGCDCGVRACAILARVPYNVAHAACKGRGRQDRQGMYLRQLIQTIVDLGYNVEDMGTLKQPNGSRYTCKTIGKRLKRGYYLVYVKGHFLSVVNGVVEDWTFDTNRRVKYVYKITKPRH